MPKKRTREIRQCRPMLHIFCEGANTEPWYFRQYINRFSRQPSRIVVEKTAKNTPVALVREAQKMMRGIKKHSGDIFWVVFDRESTVKYPESLHDQARQLAAANGINIAISNVCFEVWMLLHRRDTAPACMNCDELLARKEFRDLFPDYDKSNEIVFTPEEIRHARLCAESMNAQTIAGADKSWTVPSKWNPYTNVHHVLNAIDTLNLSQPSQPDLS